MTKNIDYINDFAEQLTDTNTFMMLVPTAIAIYPKYTPVFFFSSRRRHTRWPHDWSSDVCSSDLYPLPEAQLDRFLLKLVLPLPPREDEVTVLERHATGFDPRQLAAAGVQAVANAELLAQARTEVAHVEIARDVLGYIVDICRATRNAPSLSLGVSPRGATALLATSRAWAWLQGRNFVTPDDVKALAHPTLRHRIQLRAEAELEGVTTESVLDTVLATVPVPR